MTDYASAKETAFKDIPVIDISGLNSDLATKTRIGQQLVNTARTVGFFYVKGHGVDSALREAAFDASARFFKASSGVKNSVAIDQNQRGWLGQGLTKLEGSASHDSKEVFFWGWEIAED